MNRTQSSLINLLTAIIGQGISFPVNFVARIVFIRSLGVVYLGVNGLFTNILAMLSLMELGIGPAIVFSLYQPLAEKDETKIKALMKFYQKAYRLIGVIIAISGCMLTPFIEFFIHDVSEITEIKLIFILFLINTVISYFFSYKRSLIIADQKRYIATAYRYAFYIGLNIAQMIFLLFTQNYIYFLILQILFTFMENIMVSKRADRLYPFLKDRDSVKLSHETFQQIAKNTSAMILHKIGGVVINSTDNILISTLIGTLWVGLYSNYSIIIIACNAVLVQCFVAITASVGNLGAIASKSRILKVFEVAQFINFWLYGWACICFMVLLNPLIILWLGADLLLPAECVFFIILNFYMTGMRKSVLTFKDALGLYWFDRYKPVFESLINLGVSIILAQRIGLVGIFMGTFISCMTTSFWIEPYVVYRYGFETFSGNYFKRFACYTFSILLAGLITAWLCKYIMGGTIFHFAGKLFVCIVIPNLIFFLLFRKTKEFQQILQIIYRIF